MLSDILIDCREVCRQTCLTERRLYKMVQANQFPAPVKLGSSNRWRQSAVTFWIDAVAPKQERRSA